jgi:hypothetical protein
VRVGQSYGRPMTTTWRRIGWSLGTGATGFIGFIIYALSAVPILETCHGGMADSITVAALLGLALLIAGAVAVWHYHQKLWVTYLVFASAYGLALFVLASVSTLIWGPRHCDTIGFF